MYHPAPTFLNSQPIFLYQQLPQPLLLLRISVVLIVTPSQVMFQGLLFNMNRCVLAFLTLSFTSLNFLFISLGFILVNCLCSINFTFRNRENIFSQFSSVQSLSHVRLCDPMNCSRPGLPVHHQLPEFMQTHAHQVGDAISRPPLLLPPTLPSIRVFSNESTLRMRWPKYWSFSFSISPSNENILHGYK